jgi:hypothetical protein
MTMATKITKTIIESMFHLLSVKTKIPTISGRVNEAADPILDQLW